MDDIERSVRLPLINTGGSMIYYGHRRPAWRVHGDAINYQQAGYGRSRYCPKVN